MDTPRGRVIVITGRYRPHELVLFALSIALGMAYVFGPVRPQSLAATMPSPMVQLWGYLLLLSGLAGLFGALFPMNIERALILEGSGLLIGTGALVILTGAIFIFAGWAGLFGAGFTASWAVANLIRIRQIRRDLQELRRLT